MRLRVHRLLAIALILAACSEESGESEAGLSVLTLNLHTYQEIRTDGIEEAALTDDQATQRVRDYAPIFDRIAEGIETLDPDIICLQEVGEWPGNTDTNMVRQILARLDTPYHDTSAWSHYGWGVWLEGSAILSKHPIQYSASRFISNPDNGQLEYWKARNVPMARIDVPEIGAIAVFSVHTGWWDDPDEPAMAQYQRLLDWAAEENAPTKILCGDFNAPAGGPGYEYLISGNHWADQYLLANPTGMFDTTIFNDADGWDNTDSGQRIDYILLNGGNPLRIVHAERVFTGEDLGRVSDHTGVFVEFRE